MENKQVDANTFEYLAVKFVQDVLCFQNTALAYPDYYAVLVQKFTHHLKKSLIDFAVITIINNRKTAKRRLSKAIFKENRKVWYETYKQKSGEVAKI